MVFPLSQVVGSAGPSLETLSWMDAVGRWLRGSVCPCLLQGH